MGKYIINYNTGIFEEVEADDLNEVKEIAREGMRYTQQSITIETEDGEVITTARWFGVKPFSDDEVLEMIGGGFYQRWDDELESL